MTSYIAKGEQDARWQVYLKRFAELNLNLSAHGEGGEQGGGVTNGVQAQQPRDAGCAHKPPPVSSIKRDKTSPIAHSAAAPQLQTPPTPNSSNASTIRIPTPLHEKSLNALAAGKQYTHDVGNCNFCILSTSLLQLTL